MATKRLIVVGNGPIPTHARERIDTADAVMRFNLPPHSAEEAGSRTDILVVSNAGKPMQSRLANPTYLQSRAFVAASHIVLSYSPEMIRRYHPRPNVLSRIRGRRADWTREATELFEKAGKPVTIIPSEFYQECCDLLGISEADRRSLFPSSGFLGFRYGLKKFPPPEWKAEIVGFSWEGWSRHPWREEREWIQRYLAR